jgi:hypothetical protein
MDVDGHSNGFFCGVVPVYVQDKNVKRSRYSTNRVGNASQDLSHLCYMPCPSHPP